MTIQEKFNVFNQSNPTIYTELVRLARVAKAQGIRNYGAKAMCEVLRFNFVLLRQGKPFKINNVYTSRYARLIDQKEPDLRGFFKTRELKS